MEPTSTSKLIENYQKILISQEKIIEDYQHIIRCYEVLIFRETQKKKRRADKHET
jgi:hypothetical protein